MRHTASANVTGHAERALIRGFPIQIFPGLRDTHLSATHSVQRWF